MENSLSGKSILVIYQPWREFRGSLHSILIEGLKGIGLQVTYLDIENPPQFKNNHIVDKFRNVFERKFRNNKQYILYAENKHYNRFFYSQLLKLNKKGEKYDFVLIIKPDEFSEKVVHLASTMGNKTVGYIWDGLRLFLKPNLDKNRKFLDELYSFDKNNIKDFPELDMKFLTNYYVPDAQLTPFNERKVDVYYIGALAGTLPTQRRDWKMANLIKHLKGNLDIRIHISREFQEKDKGLKPEVNYTTEFTTLQENYEKTRNSKIVIDICKSHHIGLSFRFFECLLYKTKIITNNTDVVNYDFYHPNNILVVDFDHIDDYAQQLREFQETPYHDINETIRKKYSLENWIKYIFKQGDYIPF